MRSLVTLFMTRRLPLGMLGSLVACGMLACHLSSRPVHGMFTDRSRLIPFSTRQLNYGVAVADVDGDGELEWIVAGFSGPNLVLKLDKTTGYYYNLATEEDDRFQALRDSQGQAIGVCACDIDGDGREEIYFLNTNDRYSGPKRYKDKLFKWRRGADGRERYENLFDDAGNNGALSMFAGRSVAAVDRKGTGKYSIILATYAEYGQGSFGLIEMDEAASDVASGRIVLRNVAQEAGIAMSTGGRGITVGPIMGNDGHSDIFFDNEGGYRGNDPRNALFVNDGNGRFTNMAQELGLSDPSPGRGVALGDFNNDGRIDIVYGNWMDPHRLMLQQEDGTFQNASSPEMAARSPIRTVIAADFDNDGVLEVFYNNIVYSRGWGSSPPETWENRVFRVAPSSSGGVSITKLDIGDALEPNGYGTGGAVADMDGDGQLELLLSHGESSAQDLSLYHVTSGHNNNWLRIMPLTRFNAPARGAKVTVTLGDNTRLTRVVDGGSGYLCQMEPVAHFGLGSQSAVQLRIQWPDGSVYDGQLSSQDLNKLHRIPPPSPAPSRGGGGDGTLERRGYQVGESYQGVSRTGGASSSRQDSGNRRTGLRTSNRGASAGIPYRRTSARRTTRRRTNVRRPYRGGSASAPHRQLSSDLNNRRANGGLHNRRTSPTSGSRQPSRDPTGRQDASGHSQGRPSIRSSTSATNSSSELACITASVRNFIRDESRGCYSARPIRMGQCQGTCSRGGNCCQPRQDRYRSVLFACRDGARYRKVVKAGVRRCRCVRCPA
ncbi:cartilage acidic protein 1-like [Babylonia areolata]|uniref:cartilage acidic protein 1-like n=1 Tax=Babylonia areolata TaxID=304850 RepID=UPI003FD1D5B8